MRQAGRHLEEYLKLREKAKTFIDFCLTPDLVIEATLQPIRRYDIDAAILFSDILIIPYGLGRRVDFLTGTGPVLDKISSTNDINQLNVKRSNEILEPIYEAIKIIKLEIEKMSDTLSLIGFAGSPWTVATYMIEGGSSKDFQTTRRWAFKAPEEFSLLINILIDVSISFLNLIKLYSTRYS